MQTTSDLMDSTLNVNIFMPAPSGVSQSGLVADGPLGSILTVGNLKRVKLNSDKQTGEWKISIDSTSSYTLRVIGKKKFCNK